MKYKECPACGAHLDYGEVCDCKKDAVPCATNTADGKNGKVKKAISANIVADGSAFVNCREVYHRCS